MVGKNWRLVTNEPVEFENSLVAVQDFKIITDHSRGIYRIYIPQINESSNTGRCQHVTNRLDLESLGS